MTDQLSQQQQLAIREAFRAEMDFAAKPILESAVTDYQSAMRFAEVAIKGGFLLNGGALIALPAILAVLPRDSQPLKPIVVALVCFGAGLIFAWLTSAFGFFAARQGERAKLASYEATRLHYTLVWRQGPPEALPSMDDVNGERNEFLLAQSYSERLTRCAVVFGVLSVAAFILGAGISAISMLARAGAL